EGLPPREATRRSMGQITSALIGIGLVLSAVFVPMAFFGGSTGVIYRQFSITIVAAMALSVLVAIVFTPALCATLLKPVEQGHNLSRSGFFGWFNRTFDRGTRRYEGLVGSMLRRSLRFMLVFVAIVGLLAFLFTRLPTSFLPEEDQGVMFTQVILPSGATQERTLETLRKVEHQFLVEEKETVRALFTVAGFSFAGRGQNMGIGFVNLKPWDERQAPGLDVKSLQRRAMGAFSQIREAMVFAFVPPAVIELGTSGGFNMQLQDRSGLGHEALLAARNQLLGMAAKDPRLAGVRPNGQEDTAQLKLDIDLQKAGALGVSASDINATLATAWGGTYVNDFVDRGRIKRVYVQADAPARMSPEDMNKWYVRNSDGAMVPFSAFTRSRWEFGPQRLERFNGQPSMEIQGQAAPGYSSGEAMQAIAELVGQLQPGIGYAWSGTSFQEQQSGDQAPALLALSLLIVFLCLAALYESWSVPFAVMLVVPLGVLGAVLAATTRGLSNDIYFQVGLLATIGLSAKNAILIVEFAKAQMEEAGKPLIEATLEAVRMRLRPILMTSLAFGFGVLPLAIASGAGAGSQNAIGTGVLGGTIAATALGIFFVPLFFVVIKRVFTRRKAAEPATPPALGAGAAATAGSE
ncbi:MAG: efflux RND transporter permease subunit, partial [Rhodocyclaceae bacterium]|nr:efflux RND transporter permease subunit [Rhodocyclaceae bacterium]